MHSYHTLNYEKHAGLIFFCTLYDRHQPIMLIFPPIMLYAAVLKILTYYAQYYAHVKMICA